MQAGEELAQEWIAERMTVSRMPAQAALHIPELKGLLGYRKETNHE